MTLSGLHLKFLQYCEVERRLALQTIVAYRSDFAQFLEFLREGGRWGLASQDIGTLHGEPDADPVVRVARSRDRVLRPGGVPRARPSSRRDLGRCPARTRRTGVRIRARFRASDLLVAA